MSAVERVDQEYWLSRRWWQQVGRSGIVLFIGSGFGFLSSVVAARAVDPVGFGQLALATSVVASIATFLDFSLEEAVVHHGARLLEEGRPGDLRALLRQSFVLDTSVGIAVFLLLFALAGPLAQVVSGGTLPPLLIQLAAVEMLMTTVNGTSGATLMLGGRPEMRAWTTALITALRLLCVVAIVNLTDGGVESVLCGYIVGSALGSSIQLVLARRVARGWGGPRTDRHPIPGRSLASFGLHSSVTTTLIGLRTAVVAVWLGRTAGPVAVGLLAVAMLPVTIATVASAPIRLLTFPEQARLAARQRFDLLWRSIKTHTSIALVVGAAASLVGYVILPTLLRTLYSEAYAAAVTPARILLPAAVASLAVAWAKAFPAAVGRPKVRTWVSLGELAITVCAIVALAPRGLTGAAAAVSLSTLISAIVWLLVAGSMLSRLKSMPGALR
jgi:O-antigen/teichoic acid export membrane protein